MTFLLDTDTCIHALRHDPRILSRLGASSPDDISVASMTEAELWYGAWGSRDPALDRQGALPVAEAVALAREIADALA